MIGSMLTNCLKKACTWPELLDQTFSGQSTNLPDQSQNGLKVVTDVWPDWFPRSITQIITVNIAMWETQHNITDWGLFQDSDFAGYLEDSKSTSGVLCIFGSRTFVPISWMCKKQTSVSHSSTESEIISLECWFANGRFARSWSVGHCNWCIAFDAR